MWWPLMLSVCPCDPPLAWWQLLCSEWGGRRGRGATGWWCTITSHQWPVVRGGCSGSPGQCTLAGAGTWQLTPEPLGPGLLSSHHKSSAECGDQGPPHQWSVSSPGLISDQPGRVTQELWDRDANWNDNIEKILVLCQLWLRLKHDFSDNENVLIFQCSSVHPRSDFKSLQSVMCTMLVGQEKGKRKS